MISKETEPYKKKNGVKKSIAIKGKFFQLQGNYQPIKVFFRAKCISRGIK